MANDKDELVQKIGFSEPKSSKKDAKSVLKNTDKLTSETEDLKESFTSFSTSLRASGIVSKGLGGVFSGLGGALRSFLPAVGVGVVTSVISNTADKLADLNQVAEVTENSFKFLKFLESEASKVGGSFSDMLSDVNNLTSQGINLEKSFASLSDSFTGKTGANLKGLQSSLGLTDTLTNVLRKDTKKLIEEFNKFDPLVDNKDLSNSSKLREETSKILNYFYNIADKKISGSFEILGEFLEKVNKAEAPKKSTDILGIATRPFFDALKIIGSGYKNIFSGREDAKSRITKIPRSGMSRNNGNINANNTNKININVNSLSQNPNAVAKETARELKSFLGSNKVSVSEIINNSSNSGNFE